MTNQFTDIKTQIIQAQLELFLQTNPEPKAVNSLIDRLKEYESERQRQAAKADLAWQEQLPNTFLNKKDKGLREKFREIFDQLTKQGISVCYDLEHSDNVTEKWKLTEGEKVGFLYYFRAEKRCELYGFTFQDERGNPFFFKFAHVKTL